MIRDSMVSTNFGTDIATYKNILLKDLKPEVLIKLGKTLNDDGPSNWKKLQEVISSKVELFSIKEIQDLSCCPLLDSTMILSLLCDKGVTVEFLIDCLRLLPCLCALKVLQKHLSSFISPMIRQSGREYSSVPTTFYGNSLNVNSFVPTSFAYSEPPKESSMIREHPSNQEVEVGGEIILKCTVAATCHAKFQWFHLFTPLKNQTRHMLLIPDAKLSNQGFYCCRVTIQNRPEKSKWAFVSVGPKGAHHATDKVALLIGNACYANHKQLPATTRDIEQLTHILQTELNFKTYSFVNLTFTEIHRALQWLCEKSKKGCYCLFYFGGHGYENDGKCFMVPVDAPKEYTNSHCVNAHNELENIQRRCSPSLMLILLDICRKRNFNESASSRRPTTFLGNVVQAYATMESREAFERHGDVHGVFVDALLRHLTKPIRVNFMLSYAQEDVKKSGVQEAEVRQTLSENRCLTDPISPGMNTVEALTRWLHLHDMLPSDPLIFELGNKTTDAKICLSFHSIVTNKIAINVHVTYFDKAKWQGCRVFIHRDKIPPQLLPEKVSEHPYVLHVSNLQRLQGPLALTVEFLSCGHDGKLYRQTFEETILPQFVRCWNGRFF